jgi:hypothetical protein
MGTVQDVQKPGLSKISLPLFWVSQSNLAIYLLKKRPSIRI